MNKKCKKPVRPEPVEGSYRTMTNCHAFTLIELMVVIALCALLVTLALVNTRHYNHAVVCAELKTIRSACAYLRSKAMSLGTEEILSLDPERNRYTFDGTTHQLPRCVRFGYAPGVVGPPASPRALITKPITFKKNRIVFYPTGIISAGTIYFTDRDQQVQYALSCAVSQYSFLRLYRYGKKWSCLSG